VHQEPTIPYICEIHFFWVENCPSSPQLRSIGRDMRFASSDKQVCINLNFDANVVLWNCESELGISEWNQARLLSPKCASQLCTPIYIGVYWNKIYALKISVLSFSQFWLSPTKVRGDFPKSINNINNGIHHASTTESDVLSNPQHIPCPSGSARNTAPGGMGAD